MNVYRADVGAIYHVAANNVGEAVAALWKCWCDEGSEQDVEDSLSIERLREKDWPETYNDEGTDDRKASFADLVAKQTGPAVLICSEWP